MTDARKLPQSIYKASKNPPEINICFENFKAWKPLSCQNIKISESSSWTKAVNCSAALQWAEKRTDVVELMISMSKRNAKQIWKTTTTITKVAYLQGQRAVKHKSAAHNNIEGFFQIRLKNIRIYKRIYYILYVCRYLCTYI